MNESTIELIKVIKSKRKEKGLTEDGAKELLKNPRCTFLSIFPIEILLSATMNIPVSIIEICET